MNKENPFGYVELRDASLLEEPDGIGFTRKIAKIWVENLEAGIVEEIKEKAKAEGFTGIHLLNHQFIFDALREKMDRDAEIVRCKDCEYWGSGILTSTENKDCKRCEHPNLYSEGFCDDYWLETYPDDFCSYGIRKENNDDQT